MTIEQLRQLVPADLHPLVGQYGPVLVEMAAADLRAWLDAILAGRDIEAYRIYCTAADAAGLSVEWMGITDELTRLNVTNAVRLQQLRTVGMAIVTGLVSLGLAAL